MKKNLRLSERFKDAALSAGARIVNWFAEVLIFQDPAPMPGKTKFNPNKDSKQ